VDPAPPRMVRRVTLAAFATVVLLTPLTARAQTAPPNPGASGTPGSSGTPGPSEPAFAAADQVVISGSVVVPKGSAVGDVVIFHGRAIVSGSVSGDLVVLDGPITIAGGYITGTVVALNGSIRITGPSLIGGDVLGGRGVHVDQGVRVGGQVREHVGFTLRGPLAVLGILLGSVAVAFSVLLLGLALLLIAPRGADRVADAASTSPFSVFGWGLVAAVGLPIVCVALLASVVGVPLGLTIVLGIAFLLLVGLTWTAWAVGRALVRSPRSRWPAFLAGWGILAVVSLVPFLNVAAWGAGAVFGLGAMLVAAWRLRGSPRGGRHRVGGALAEFATPAPTTPQVAAPAPPDRPQPEPSYPATSDD
jgi:hypothetical protein